jgi:hypothetical protein
VKENWHWHDMFGRKDGIGEPILTNSLGDRPRVGSGSVFSFAVSDDSGFVVAHCTNALVTCSTERSESNARLMAASPQMYRALNATLKHLENLHSEDAYGSCTLPLKDCDCDLSYDYNAVLEAIEFAGKQP